jgi:hypothetical protein
VYRADLPRTLTLVVALLLIVVAPTSVFAREFCIADSRCTGRLVAERSGGRLQIRVFHSGLATQPIDGAENNWPSFVTTEVE